MRYDRLEKVNKLLIKLGVDVKVINTENQMRQNVARQIVALQNNWTMLSNATWTIPIKIFTAFNTL